MNFLLNQEPFLVHKRLLLECGEQAAAPMTANLVGFSCFDVLNCVLKSLLCLQIGGLTAGLVVGSLSK